MLLLLLLASLKQLWHSVSSSQVRHQCKEQYARLVLLCQLQCILKPVLQRKMIACMCCC
jgi:hypothetical protein